MNFFHVIFLGDFFSIHPASDNVIDKQPFLNGLKIISIAKFQKVICSPLSGDRCEYVVKNVYIVFLLLFALGK